MADKLIQDLGAGAFALTDLLEHQPIAGPPSLKGDVAALVTLLNTIYAPITGGAYVLKAGDTMTGLLTIAQATANTSNLILSGQSLTGANAQSLLSMTGTWNTSGNPVALRLAITDTASGASSNVMQILGGAGGATNLFSVSKAGLVTIAGSINTAAGVAASQFQGINTAGIDLNGGAGFATSYINLFSPSDGVLRLYNASSGNMVFIALGASDILAIRNGATAQQFRWYRTFTNDTNYERGALRTAAGQVIVAAETAGTGTDDIDLVLTPAGVGNVTLPGGVLLKTVAALTNGAAAALGTLANAPVAGNPTKWVPINDNGTTRYIPCW